MLMTNSSCLKCGICMESCPIGIIGMDNDVPRLIYPEACVRCGHCVAVCPKGALDHEKVPFCNQVPVDSASVLDPQTASRFLKSRRSIRCYKQDAVPKDSLLQLLNIARFAPSGGNSQGLSYIVVTKRELMKKLTEVTVKWIEELLDNDVAWVKPYENLVQTYRDTRRDVILREAPHLIIATAPKELAIGRDNTRYSLAYTELFAQTLGLGTCWAGFFEMCAFSGYPELYNLLEVEEGMIITGAIMVGYPRYTYQRLVDRNPLELTWR
jgi:nitroreductase/NAD-dependent dihydropyrimidine dehydrogenase PreA subunit